MNCACADVSAQLCSSHVSHADTLVSSCVWMSRQRAMTKPWYLTTQDSRLRKHFHPHTAGESRSGLEIFKNMLGGTVNSVNITSEMVQKEDGTNLSDCQKYEWA